MTLKLLAFDGSGRAGSLNHKLVLHVMKMAEQGGAQITHIHLPEYDLPIYTGDVEKDEGLPDGAKKLKDLFQSHDGFLIASPEYNGSLSGLLKNTLDWVSRPVEGKPYLGEFKGKIAGIMAAAPGKMGGLRGLYQLNTILFGVGTLVLPEIVSVGFYNEAFDDAGALKREDDKKAAEALVKRLHSLGKAVKN